MVWQVLQMLLKQYSLKRVCNCVLFIWWEIPSAMCPTKTAKLWLLTCGSSTPRFPEAEAEQQLISFAEKWDKQYPTRAQILVESLAAYHSLLCLPAWDSQSHLYHQCNWVGEYDAAKSPEKSSRFSHRWFCPQSCLPGYPKHLQKVDNAHQGLEACFKSIRDHLRRQVFNLTSTSDTKLLTYPTIDEIVAEAGCELWYLPPYSPDLNQIEHWWFALKNWMRQRWNEFDSFHDCVDAAFKHCPNVFP